MKKKDILLMLLLGIAFIGALFLLNKIDDDFMRDCTNGGNLKEFCERELRGE